MKPTQPARPARLCLSTSALALLVAIVAVLAALLTAAPAPVAHAQDGPPTQTLGFSTSDRQNSAHADRLNDGQLGTTESASWVHSGNRWGSDYPMSVVLDLGQPTDLEGLWIYQGQIPFADDAELGIAVSDTGATGDFDTVTFVSNPAYNQWSSMIDLSGIETRYVELSFQTMRAHFAVTEVAITGDGGNPEIEIDFTPVDGDNSERADRLNDGVLGTAPNVSWWNPNIFELNGYEMNAVLELDGTYAVSRIEYLVGNLNIGADELSITAANGQVVVADSHQWGEWRVVDLGGVSTDEIELSFASSAARFNITEVVLYGQAN